MYQQQTTTAILSAISKRQKTIAWLLFMVFYLNFFAVASANNSAHTTRAYSVTGIVATNNSTTTPIGNKNLEPVISITEEKNSTTTSTKKLQHIANAVKATAALSNTNSGPGQPEMSSFKSVSADNMVNPFTGDFSYNIPLLDVGGYPINIFYNGGITMEQEATWVGLGWNLNPGTINRTMRGMPDDFNGEDKVEKEQTINQDLTVGVKAGADLEKLGIPKKNIKVKANLGIQWNNQRGVSINLGAGAEKHSIFKLFSSSVADEKNNKDSIKTTGWLNGSANVGLNLSSADGLTPSLGFGASLFKTMQFIKSGESTTTPTNSTQGVAETKVGTEIAANKPSERTMYDGSMSLSFARPSYMPTIQIPTTNASGLLDLKLGKAKSTSFKNIHLQGFVSKNFVANEDKRVVKPAYGFMYYHLGQFASNAVMDFNRLNDRVYNTKVPVVSLPVYTYDVFTINGEGTGGSFRGYRGSVGYVKDAEVSSKSFNGNLAIELGAGNLLHGGTQIGGAYSKSRVKEWGSQNALREHTLFTNNNKQYEGFYFKNPAEMAIIDEDFYEKIGRDKLIRPVFKNENGLVNNGVLNIYSATPTLESKYQTFTDEYEKGEYKNIDANLQRTTRDKRTQVISFLTAGEASKVGLDKSIWAYTENMFMPSSCTNGAYKKPFARYNEPNTLATSPARARQIHHISEITVLEGDAKRYIYGLPVYTKLQKEVSFSVNSDRPIADNKVDVIYNPAPGGVNPSDGSPMPQGDNSILNGEGDGQNKEKFFQSQKLTNFAHGFLLTAILSPDYVDVKGDGITDDDLGTAIKFNYSFANLPDATSNVEVAEDFKWRYPACSNPAQPTASFNIGLVTDKIDNKASYTYGKKELWYMHSIESKNMVATFTISKRKDGMQATGENGGVNSNIVQRKLERIDLYTKADYNKNPAKAKPIKTVFFEYDYSLCGNYVLNDGVAIDKNGGNPQQTNLPNVNAAKGKLTLKRVWFTYNGSNRKSGEYVFNYAGNKTIVENNQNVVINANPDYNTSQSDRWGNYKPNIGNNPLDVNNTAYPFAVQKADRANAYAAAWSLEKILLPSGALLTVDYESDSYSYVQDKRATVATKIVGFGFTKSMPPSNFLYMPAAPLNLDDNRFVFFQANEPNLNKQQIYERYLVGINQLLLKIWVKVPSDSKGDGYEPVFVYSPIRDYGPVPGNASLFYIELQPVFNAGLSGGYGSPIVQTIFNYMRTTLPSKVFPGYDNGTQSGLSQIAKAIWGLADRMVQAVTGYQAKLKMARTCIMAHADYCFARLNAPAATKYGGGHRVKKIIIRDNWNKISKTGNTEVEKESFYGQEYFYDKDESIGTTPASISSGVATYEPGVGNEENPFREILEYSNPSLLAPTLYANVEMPVAETFFPSPMIGYSRVTIKSINRNKPAENIKIKSGIGKQVKEFYTSRDFPVIADFIGFDNESKRTFNPNPIIESLKFTRKSLLSLTQGFRVILNDMHGKPKGDYSYPEGDDKTIINSTQYFYRTTKIGENKYRLNNVVPVLKGPNSAIENKLVGKDVEVMNDSREHYKFSHAGNVPLNLDVWRTGPAFAALPTIFRAVLRDEDLFRSFTTLKVVNEFGILERVENNDKGSIVSTQNEVYDAETGGVLISKTNNEFKKPVYNVNYPAHWADKGMAPAYKNIDVTYSNVTFLNGRLDGNGVDMNLFESGDELYVNSNPNKGPVTDPACTGGTPITLTPSATHRVWAVDLRKDPTNTQTEPDFIFIDREGNPYNGANVYVRIIRSGHRNLIGANVGAVTCKNNPIDPVTNKLAIDVTTKAINASAVLLKERWKGQDMFYVKDAVVNTQTFAPIVSATVFATKEFFVRRYSPPENSTTTNNTAYDYLQGRGYFVTDNIRNVINPQYPSSHTAEARTWMEFNLTSIPTGARIKSAELFLSPHTSTANGTGHQPEDLIANHNAPSTPHYITGYRDQSKLRVGRLLSPWPQNNNAWGLQFNNISSNEGSVSLGTVFTNVGAFPSNLPYTSSRPVTFYNLRNLVDEMVRDRDDVTKNYATAFYIRHDNIGFTPSSYDARFCFASHTIAPSSGQRTELRLQYYDCSQAVAMSPAPDPYLFEPCNSSTAIVKQCFSVFTRQFMNPYVQGILGNWRPWRSYVFYGERTENDLSATPANNNTDIANDGTLKDFVPYWQINQVQNKIEPTTSTKWVWNSEVTQYNRKGAQLEDHDALNRYNAAIYGYQETLPIATVNNSRLRQSAFDGFEDYYYKDDICEPLCKPAKIHFKTGINVNALDEMESHTGKYSYKLDAQQAQKTLSIDLPVSPDNTALDPVIKIDITKTPYVQQNFTLNGQGLHVFKDEKTHCMNLQHTYPDANIQRLAVQMFNTNQDRSRFVKGKLIVDISGTYVFELDQASNDYAAFQLGGETYPSLLTTVWANSCQWPQGENFTVSKNLIAGQVYNLEVRTYNRRRGPQEHSGFEIRWKKPGENHFEQVTIPYLYLDNQVPLPPTTSTGICYSPQQIQATANATIDGFNLIPNKKMVAGIWVKKGGQDCKCNNYTGITIDIKNGLQSIGTLVPKSKIIEGWQLFEGEFTVPANTTMLKFEATAGNGTLFYLDDLRIHPFNANMKSFVFDPQNLRLASELDENNYASFYEYDDEGTLVRVKKETKDGIKTIKESRSAIQGKIKDIQ
jgi:hypothetical protein